jgi:hypothetical protein
LLTGIATVSPYGDLAEKKTGYSIIMEVRKLTKIAHSPAFTAE